MYIIWANIPIWKLTIRSVDGTGEGDDSDDSGSSGDGGDSKADNGISGDAGE